MKSVDRSVFEMVSRSSSFCKDLRKVEWHAIPLRGSDGIMGFLGQMVDGHTHDKRINSVRGSIGSGNHPCFLKNAADVRTDSYFHSVNDINQYKTYDFKDMKVLVTHCLFRSAGCQANGDNVRF
jgi:hypothetical protein